MGETEDEKNTRGCVRYGFGCLAFFVLLFVVAGVVDRIQKSKQPSAIDEPSNAQSVERVAAQAKVDEELRGQQEAVALEVKAIAAESPGVPVESSTARYVVHKAWWSRTADGETHIDSDDHVEAFLCADLEITNLTRKRIWEEISVLDERGEELTLKGDKPAPDQWKDEVFYLEGKESHRGLAVWPATTGLRHVLVVAARGWDNSLPSKYIELSPMVQRK